MYSGTLQASGTDRKAPLSVGVVHAACAIGSDVYCRPQHSCATQLLGTGDGEWCIATSNLSPTPLVLSFGVGTDIGFEIEICARGGRVHMFDPTPISRDWLSRRTLPPGIEFHAYGISDHDGFVTFSLPQGHGSSFAIDFPGASKQSAQCEVRTFASVLRDIKCRSIDILKMDIEGAEYRVLPQILSADVDVKQILIEFHHRWWGRAGVRQTRQAIASLRKCGYRCFYQSPRRLEYGFVKV